MAISKTNKITKGQEKIDPSFMSVAIERHPCGEPIFSYVSCGCSLARSLGGQYDLFKVYSSPEEAMEDGWVFISGEWVCRICIEEAGQRGAGKNVKTTKGKISATRRV